MSKRRTAIVVGAGLGGIAAAARLARHGYQVTVLEKNDSPGGRCSQILRDGHRFDIGPTLFLMPEVVAETFTALGQRMEDHLDLRRIDPTYRVRFGDGAEIALTSDLHALQPQLEALEPGSFPGFLAYLAEGYRNYYGSLRYFVGRNWYSLLDYLNPCNLPMLLQLKALLKHYDNVGHYFRNERLKEAFTFQDMYLGLSPFDALATYSLLQYTELAGGVWFPVGGVYRLVESLAAIAQGQGVAFRYGAAVERIAVEDRRATGVLLSDGSLLQADVIVANADLPYVYSHLLPDQAAAERLARKRYTSSAIMFYWGVDRVYPQLDTHNVFLAGDYRASFERIFRDHTLPDEPSFYVHAPARVDPTAAPPGQDSLMVLVPVGHLDEASGQDWPALQGQAREAVLARLAAMGIGDLREHLKFEVSYTPRSWAGLYNLAKGAAFGLGHDFWQVGYFRPANRHPRYGNLYFAGSSTHPGTGMPLVLISARLATERIFKEQQPASST